MAITSKESILKVLTAYNPWWKTGIVNPKMSKTYKRFAFHEAMKKLNQKDIRRTVVLSGTRRVGKTTIQYQMIEALLTSGVAPQKIVFISMDHPMLKLSQFQERPAQEQKLQFTAATKMLTQSALALVQNQHVLITL